MTKQELEQHILSKRSCLCVGLDTDLNKIPEHLLQDEDPVFAFNRAIVDATAPYCVAYKPNVAFYECMGPKGWESLKKTVEYIRQTYPDQFIIADAKRGDIGNTSRMYAKTFFEWLGADAVTVAPYMGEDSVKPFLEYPGKWVILLACTSNAGTEDFQQINLGGLEHLYERVVSMSKRWAGADQMMYVVGATHPWAFETLRHRCPEHFFLVPGIGAQGGSLDAVMSLARNSRCGLLINSSRAIIYADKSERFAQAAAQAAQEVQKQMQQYIIY